LTDVARLYRYFSPSHYTIHLNIDSTNLTFTGEVSITGDRKNDTKELVLHAYELNIIDISVNSVQCEFTTASDDRLIITLPEDCQDQIHVVMHYSARITKAMHGIYPAYTKDGSVIIGTQFESHHAREAFPCIDEPEAKAIFDVSITSDAPVVLGNMPRQRVVDNKDGTKTTNFATSPVMSTYLVAFVTGDLQNVTTSMQDGTEISVWSSKDHDIESLVFPLEVAVKVTEFFNDYFGVAYPLPKCDHVALPDFSSGAMENWGLITYREIALLADPSTTSTSAKEYIATVIAHEISHQWFGNLVTMRWWDDLWLNESFATLMEYLVIDAIYPDWNVMLSFASHEALSAFRRDILPGVQSVATPVHHPDEISTLFDPSIVYAKGARLLYMAYHLVGDRNFKKGLQAYFEKHAYSNTTGEDLWNALSKASGLDVASIMHPWIMQSGFPYVTVEPNDDRTIRLRQQQLTTADSPSDKLWPIPLWHSPTEDLIIFDSEEKVISVDDPHVRINSIGGHYIPMYTSLATKKVIYTDVKKKNISPDSRLLLLHDPLLLARCGSASLIDALDVLQYYKNETEESVWSVISLVISDTRMMIEGDEVAEDHLKKFTFTLVEKLHTKLGFLTTEKDTSNDRKLRTIVAGLAVYSEHPEVIAEAVRIYSAAPSIDTLPVDTRSSILTAVVKFGENAIFDSLLDAYPSTINADIQQDIAGALCATKKAKQYNTLIAKFKDQSYIRLQDLDRFIIYLLRNQKSRESTWKWLVDNWDWITEVFAQDKSYDNYPRYAGAVFSSEEWLTAYTSHFGPLSHIPSLARNIDLGTKDIASKIAWKNKDRHHVISWLTALKTS
jgi:aminopeptidase N